MCVINQPARALDSFRNFASGEQIWFGFQGSRLAGFEASRLRSFKASVGRQGLASDSTAACHSRARTRTRASVRIDHGDMKQTSLACWAEMLGSARLGSKLLPSCVRSSLTSGAEPSVGCVSLLGAQHSTNANVEACETNWQATATHESQREIWFRWPQIGFWFWIRVLHSGSGSGFWFGGQFG